MQPRVVAPYFMLAALVHAAAVATRFPELAAKLPPGAADAIMVAQLPLVLLSGYFEGRLEYGPALEGLPLWMTIRSRSVKLAFTTAFIYVTVVAAQTFHVSLGPADPAAPDSFPLQQRALWFAVFTAGFFAIYYMAATALFVPILRAVTRPLRPLPTPLGALCALALGGAAGIAVLALATRQQIPAFFDAVHTAADKNPGVFFAVLGAGIAIPWLVGVIVARVNSAGRTEGAEPARAMSRAAAQPPADGPTRSAGTANNSAGRTEGAEPARAMSRAAAQPPADGPTRSAGTANNRDG